MATIRPLRWCTTSISPVSSRTPSRRPARPAPAGSTGRCVHTTALPRRAIRSSTSADHRVHGRVLLAEPVVGHERPARRRRTAPRCRRNGCSRRCPAGRVEAASSGHQPLGLRRRRRPAAAGAGRHRARPCGSGPGRGAAPPAPGSSCRARAPRRASRGRAVGQPRRGPCPRHPGDLVDLVVHRSPTRRGRPTTRPSSRRRPWCARGRVALAGQRRPEPHGSPVSSATSRTAAGDVLAGVELALGEGPVVVPRAVDQQHVHPCGSPPLRQHAHPGPAGRR